MLLQAHYERLPTVPKKKTASLRALDEKAMMVKNPLFHPAGFPGGSSILTEPSEGKQLLRKYFFRLLPPQLFVSHRPFIIFFRAIHVVDV
jgi:hypothetical protein